MTEQEQTHLANICESVNKMTPEQFEEFRRVLEDMQEKGGAENAGN